MKKIFSKIKYIKLQDILGIFLFLITFIPAGLYKLYLKISKQEMWLICEQKNTARDNGYFFYIYMCQNHPEIKCLYAINKKSKYYNKVKEYGKIISWGSIEHYFYYLSSTKNISAHKDGNPNQLLFTILHIYLNLYNNRIFLQHGIIKDDIPMFYYKNTKFKGFICGAKKEYDYVCFKYGYPKGSVVYSGLARFDSLVDKSQNRKLIAIIPTWRNWLGRDTNILAKQISFEETEYYKRWNGLLNSKEFNDLIENNNIEVIFYPHIQMQKYIKYFNKSSKNIKIIDINNLDIQDLLKQASLLITDYSSVYFDFAYMNKPTIYYQFDYNEYREKQLQEGYFDYQQDGFGPICQNEYDIIKNVGSYIKNDFKQKEKYISRHNIFFEKKDNKNCERIYEFIMNRK